MMASPLGAFAAVGSRATATRAVRASTSSSTISSAVPTVASSSSHHRSSVSLRAPRPAAALFTAAASHRPSLTPARRGRSLTGVQTQAMSDAAAAAPGGASPSSSSEEDGDKFSLIALLRAQSFYLVTFTLALPLFAIMLVLFPFTYFTDKYRRYALSFINDVWATVSTGLFFKVEVGLGWYHHFSQLTSFAVAQNTVNR
jgi:hypothetical protein